MAILHPNTLIGSLQGTLGDLVLVRTRDGKVISPGQRPAPSSRGATPLVQTDQRLFALKRANHSSPAALRRKEQCQGGKSGLPWQGEERFWGPCSRGVTPRYESG